MSNVYSDIKKKLQELCQKQTSALILAEVKKVDGTTCTVAIDDLELSDVRLRAVVNEEESGIVVSPKVGSMVMITDLSHGNMRDWAVIMYSEIDNITINGGKNNGMINIQDLTDKLNALVDWCKNHTHDGVITAVSGGSGLPATGTPGNTGKPITTPNEFDKSDYEDDKITH